jgi:hypothetical protein
MTTKISNASLALTLLEIGRSLRSVDPRVLALLRLALPHVAMQRGDYLNQDNLMAQSRVAEALHHYTAAKHKGN